MSRIGKQVIEIPEKVDLKVDGDLISIKGPKGSLSWNLPKGVKLEQKENTISISVSSQTKRLKALWGTSRALIANMIKGVSEGYEKRLQMEGVGYRAQVQGDTLTLAVGFSHPVEIKAPENISFLVEKNIIIISGIDKILVGETAARIRAVRKPEPYKGKGIRYEGEIIRRKAGKKAISASG